MTRSCFFFFFSLIPPPPPPPPYTHTLSLAPSMTRHLKALIIDGKAIAQDIKDEIKAEVEVFLDHGFRAPHLTVILVGNDPASVIYVRNKAKAAGYTGVFLKI